MRGKPTLPQVVENVKALYATTENYSEVARILNLPARTVEQLVKSDDEFAELRDEQKKIQIIRANEKALEFLTSMDATKSKSESEKAIVYGTLIDKTVILSGENRASINIGNKSLTLNVGWPFKSYQRENPKSLK